MELTNRPQRLSSQPHFSAAWSRTGRKGPYACYYVHMEPGKCFVGGGLWHPDGGALHKLRASIDERPRRWRRVLADGAFQRTFLPAARDADEESAVKAFAGANAENALKTKPKVSDHPVLFFSCRPLSPHPLPFFLFPGEADLRMIRAS